MKRWSLLSLSLAALAASATPVVAQSNTIAGLDVKLGLLGGVQVYGHGGTFPTGYTAMAMTTTSCNVGTALLKGRANQRCTAVVEGVS